MNRLLLPPLLAGLAVLLTACPQPTPEPPPPPLELAWQAALVTPDQEFIADAAANDRYVYVFNDELPLDNDYGKKWAALWRVDVANGTVLGPVKFPDDAAAATLAANGFGCPQPLGPKIAVDGQNNVYVRVALRNTAAQAVGCDTYDGSWVASTWSAFGIYDADLNRTGLAWLKAFDGDDPTYTSVHPRLAHTDAGVVVAGAYRAESRILQTRTFRGTLSPDGVLNVALEGPVGEHVYRAFSLPEGWLALLRPDDPTAAGWAERLVRYDAAGAEVWSVVTSVDGFPPTQYATGVPGRPGTVFVSGTARGGEPFLGAAPPADEPDRAPFVARVDSGSLTWIRWITSEEAEWFSPNYDAEIPLVYDPAYDELYLGTHNVLLALDPADGATRWITNLREIITGDRYGVADWFFTYQPQNFTHLFLSGGRLVGVSYSWWDSNLGQGSPTSRYRPLVLGFDRRY